MSRPARARYSLGSYLLEPDSLRLSLGGEPIHLANRPFKVLLYLIEHRDRVVTRQELLDTFWDGRDVYDDTLRKCVSTIRKALGDGREAPTFIETAHGAGYRYIGPFDALEAPTVVEVEETKGLRIAVETESGPAATTRAPRLSETPRSRLRVKLRGAIAVATLISSVIAATAFVVGPYSADRIAAPASPVRSIAVLPLENLTGDPSQEYFADGLTESLISELSRIHDLRVISRGSAFVFKGQDVDPREIGRRLDVAAVLEGSVRRVENRVRIEVRLVSTADGSVLWASDTYERSLSDIFAVEDEVACNVGKRLRVSVCGQAPAIGVARTKNMAAYDAFLKGTYFVNQRTGEGIRKAIELFEQATALDPEYAEAYAWLGGAHNLSVWFMHAPPADALPKAKRAAARAIELDDTLAGAHSALAGAHLVSLEFEEAMRTMARAVALSPGDADVHHAYALHLAVVKRMDEALVEIRRARELDPLSLPTLTDEGHLLYFARRYDEAIATHQRVLELNPGFAEAREQLGLAYMQKGLYAEALEEFERAIAVDGRTPLYVMEIGVANALAGKRQVALATLAELHQMSRTNYVSPVYFALLLGVLGERDQAFAALDEAHKGRSVYLVNLAADPLADPLRSDPRFGAFLTRMGLPE